MKLFPAKFFLLSIINIFILSSCFSPTNSFYSTPPNLLPPNLGNENINNNESIINFSMPNLENNNMTNQDLDVKVQNFKVREITNKQKFTQIHFSNELGLLAISNKELYKWTNDNWEHIVDNVHEVSPISSTKNRLSFLDSQSNFVWWENNQRFDSNIQSSLYVQPIHLDFATIGIAFYNGKYNLSRIEKINDRLLVSSRSEEPISAYSQPVQVNFSNTNNQNGHIAALTNPSAVYGHNVLGRRDDFTRIVFLERHSLKNQLESLNLSRDNVFEDNKLRIITVNQKNYLATVISNASVGASLTIIEANKNQLKIKKQGEPIGKAYRWMSPIVVNNEIYVNHTPHIGGEIFKYNFDDLNKKALISGSSFHQIGEISPAIYGSINDFLFVRTRNYSSLNIINLENKNIIKTIDFFSKILKIVVGNKSIFVLLENNLIHEIQIK